jgi:Putative Ig domain
MANARLDQFAFELVTLSQPAARLDQFALELATLPVPPSVTCNNPPNGSIGAPYSHAFPASGGLEPYVWSISAGSLPSGLTINSSTGVASGIPNVAGVYAFTVQVTDASLNSSTVVCGISVVGTSVTISGGGPPKVRGTCKKFNNWDECIADETWRTRRITFPPSCSIPKEWANRLPWDEDVAAIPYQAVPFNVAKSIPTPGAVDTLVCEGKVPFGYDGLLTAIYQSFEGSGFDNGSGDIVWRIQINQRFVLGLSNNPYALGSSRQPTPLTQGQILLSGQTFRYIVNVPNTSGGLIVAGSRVSCGLLGFYWPR